MPADMRLQDWGITYDELEPYFDKFEYMAGIAGKAGNLKGQKIPGGNVFEGPRSREFPVSRRRTPRSTRSSGRPTANLGYHPFFAPTANLPRPYTNPDGISRGACTYCGFCERFGCEVGAKADPTVDRLPGRAQDREAQDHLPRQRVRDQATTARTRRASSTTTAWAGCRSSRAT